MRAVPSHAARVIAWLTVASTITAVAVVRAPSAQPAASHLVTTVQARMPPPITVASTRPVRTPQSTVRRSDSNALQLSTFWGIDVSWPQCGATMPQLPAAFVMVGVNGGRPFTDNPCAAQELAFAKRHSGYAAYVNLDAPHSGDPTSYGRRATTDALRRARAAQIDVEVLWLDIEVLNHWSRDLAVNVAVINGAITALRRHGIAAGLYSSGAMWQQITGGARVDMPVWLATAATDYRDARRECRVGLGAHPALMVQYVAGVSGWAIDVDVLCSAALGISDRMFHAGTA